ncbi:MAG: hypothetical protein HN411_05620 [Waddliaceae bacterium]|jgi:thymidylate synthase ThyX|nr:hypothetical protein [Waddliaceae bacterium]MBT3578366.1 hypothetical protein [Waddliaceae bacterium]MBT4445553.1 hypothetical protein [Waddliaceae bacterium]MBT6929101.1 hypothetical protein [Waddliaceae bacterium]MBT7264405.1 hypothetical protein [Waddliaceae bacterium]
MEENYDKLTESQINTLKKHVSNTSSNVFALYNLPEVIKGALFSRYSRSSLGLRTLLIKEFIDNEEVGFDDVTSGGGDTFSAIKKAQNFYDRVLDGYGDDSVGELGSAHLAVESVSMIATKAIEESRIGGSPLEKSTRYIYFDQKVRGEYLFYREPVIMTSAYRDVYIEACNKLFATYSDLVPRLTALMQERHPRDPETSTAAYTSSLRAKVLDALRGLLPASTLTNMGIHGNGRFFEGIIHKLQSHNLAELKDIGGKAFEELHKVVPSFVRRAEITHKHHKAYAEFFETMSEELSLVTSRYVDFAKEKVSSSVSLVDYDGDAVVKVAAALLYEHSDKGLFELEEHCRKLSEEDIAGILDAACNARNNRRHKSPRALERAAFTFEIVADFGVYRDLQRHRMLTQERQALTCDYGYYIPNEILGTDMESDYRAAMDKACEVYNAIAVELPEEAQYVVPMAYNIRWYFHVNLRALQWLCELRSSPAGHPTYRYIAQRLAKDVSSAVPEFERFLKFVDYEGYELGRLDQEQRIEEKKAQHER